MAEEEGPMRKHRAVERNLNNKFLRGAQSKDTKWSNYLNEKTGQYEIGFLKKMDSSKRKKTRKEFLTWMIGPVMTIMLCAGGIGIYKGISNKVSYNKLFDALRNQKLYAETKNMINYETEVWKEVKIDNFGYDDVSKSFDKKIELELQRANSPHGTPIVEILRIKYSEPNNHLSKDKFLLLYYNGDVTRNLRPKFDIWNQNFGWRKVTSRKTIDTLMGIMENANGITNKRYSKTGTDLFANRR